MTSGPDEDVISYMFLFRWTLVALSILFYESRSRSYFCWGSWTLTAQRVVIVAAAVFWAGLLRVHMPDYRVYFLRVL